jgi:hypothetical protein
MYALLADAIVVAHFAFIIFAVAGGLLVLRWPRLIWLHLPAAAWAAAVALFGWICPLTPLENRLRVLAGDAPYTGDFVDRYLLPLIYPIGLTRDTQMLLGLGVLLLNVGVYGWLWRRRRR